MEAHDPPSFVAYYHRQSSISALPRIARTAVDGDDDEKDLGAQVYGRNTALGGRTNRGEKLRSKEKEQK